MKQRFRKRMETALRLDTSIADAEGAEKRLPEIVKRITESFCPGRFFKGAPLPEKSLCKTGCKVCWNGDEE